MTERGCAGRQFQILASNSAIGQMGAKPPDRQPRHYHASRVKWATFAETNHDVSIIRLQVAARMWDRGPGGIIYPAPSDVRVYRNGGGDVADCMCII